MVSGFIYAKIQKKTEYREYKEIREFSENSLNSLKIVND